MRVFSLLMILLGSFSLQLRAEENLASCLDYTGIWEGTCTSGGQTETSSLVIVQTLCGLIDIEGELPLVESAEVQQFTQKELFSKGTWEGFTAKAFWEGDDLEIRAINYELWGAGVGAEWMSALLSFDNTDLLVNYSYAKNGEKKTVATSELTEKSCTYVKVGEPS